MKRFFIIACAFLLPVFTNHILAQTFTAAHDTVHFAYVPGSGTINFPDDITPSANTTITWNVTATNFPSDWQAGTGICDNHLCYSSSLLWGTTGSLRNETSNTYDSGVAGDYHMQLTLSAGATTGCYYYTVKLETPGLYQQSLTFDGCVYPTSVPTVKQADEVILYPNPAQNEVNVVFDANSDIKTIAIYNLIGRPVSVFKVTGDSANMNIESLSSGIYFVRLINSHGDVVQTRKFTKQ